MIWTHGHALLHSVTAALVVYEQQFAVYFPLFSIFRCITIS